MADLLQSTVVGIKPLHFFNKNLILLMRLTNELDSAMKMARTATTKETRTLAARAIAAHKRDKEEDRSEN